MKAAGWNKVEMAARYGPTVAVLPPEEQRRLAALALHAKTKAARCKARDKLVLHTMPIVYTMATRYRYVAKMAEYDDLVSEGVLGVMRAIETYDPGLGQFITYAWQWVRAYVQRYALYNISDVHIPIHAAEANHRHAMLREELRAKGLEPSEVGAALAAEFGPDAMRRDVAIRGTGRSSIDRAVAGSDDFTMHDVLSAECESVEEEAATSEYRRMLRDHVDQVMAEMGLTERQTAIVRDRLMGSRTLADVGERFGVTRERIRQIEAQLMARLRVRLAVRLPAETRLWREEALRTKAAAARKAKKPRKRGYRNREKVAPARVHRARPKQPASKAVAA